MKEEEITKLIRRIRKARGEEETILGDNPKEYLDNLRKNPKKIEEILIKSGIYRRNKKERLVLTKRYR